MEARRLITIKELNELNEARQKRLITYQEWYEYIFDTDEAPDESNLQKLHKFSKDLCKVLGEDANEIKIQKRKIQDATKELQERIRIIGDKEYIGELLKESIEQLEPIERTEINIMETNEMKVGLLVLSDQHFGCEFDLETNVYSPDEYRSRMRHLLLQVVNDDNILNLSEFDIVCLGDCVDNILRMSSIKRQKISVVDAVIQFAEHMANWIAELQSYICIPINFRMVAGNHDQIRMLTSKPTFDEENFAKIINEFIKIRLQDHDGINVRPYVNNDSRAFYINGYQIVVSHNDPNTAVNYYRDIYGDYEQLICGHYHNLNIESIGETEDGHQRMLIHVPSIIGTDPYAKKLRKHSMPGAFFEVFNANGAEFYKVYWL